MDTLGGHRPRNVDWKRAAGLLYGDWGTSKAYVIGMAFLAAQFASLPTILAVCALTGIVGFNYIIICKHFPDGGGVYSAAREQSRVLAVLGALLLLADFIVTASLSCWDAMHYFGVSPQWVKPATLVFVLLIGFVNYFGPKHSGSFAISLAVPMVIVVLVILGLAAPHLTTANLEPAHSSFGVNWTRFVSVILALSGVEAIANLTGVMKSDEGSAPDRPAVAKTARKAIIPVAVEVVLGTALLGWAMLSLPKSLAPIMKDRYEDMMRFMGEQYGEMTFGRFMSPEMAHHFGQGLGIVIGITVGLLLLSAVNTAIGAMIGLMYMLAKDREMPAAFTKLNPHGVPWFPLLAAISFPFVLALISSDLDSMADKYAIGVVGAITVNLGSCAFNKRLHLSTAERAIMLSTFAILFVIEVTIAHTKPAALFFAVCVVGIGFGLRWWEMKRSGLETVILQKEMAEAIKPVGSATTLKLRPARGQTIMVAARGITPVLEFAADEAQLRNGTLYVLYVKELAVTMAGVLRSPTPLRWQDDPTAAKIMYPMLELGRQHSVQIIPVFSESDDTAATILDLAATLGIDILVLGVPHRSAMAHLMKGNVVREVVRNLPENIQLIIHG